MSTRAAIAHSSRGRLRLKFPEHKGNAEALWSVCDGLRPCPGVRSADANPVTGSILVLHDASDESIIAFAAAQDIFIIIAESERRQDPVIKRTVRDTVTSADQALEKLTGGQIDLRMASVMALVLVGIFDILQGNIAMIPWHAAFWYAFNIFLQSQSKTA